MEIIFYRGKPDDRTILGVRENDDGSVVCWHGYRGGDGRTSFDGELVKMSFSNAVHVRDQMFEAQEKICAGTLSRDVDDDMPMCLIGIQKIAGFLVDFYDAELRGDGFSAEIRGEPLLDF